MTGPPTAPTIGHHNSDSANGHACNGQLHQGCYDGICAERDRCCGITVAISDTHPALRAETLGGDDTGKLYVYYNDGNTAQWVSLFSFTATGGGGGAANVSNIGTPVDQLAIWTDPAHQGSPSLTFDGTTLRAPTVRRALIAQPSRPRRSCNLHRRRRVLDRRCQAHAEDCR